MSTGLKRQERDRKYRNSFQKLQREVVLLEEDEYQLERVFPQVCVCVCVGGGGAQRVCAEVVLLWLMVGWVGYQPTNHQRTNQEVLVGWLVGWLVALLCRTAWLVGGWCKLGSLVGRVGGWVGGWVVCSQPPLPRSSTSPHSCLYSGS